MQIQTVGFSQTLQKSTFTGTSQTQFSDSINSISGTVDGDCTGSINVPQLGGNQPFVYHRENCSITMSSTRIVLQSRESECPGNISDLIVCKYGGKNTVLLIFSAVLKCFWPLSVVGTSAL